MYCAIGANVTCISTRMKEFQIQMHENCKYRRVYFKKFHNFFQSFMVNSNLYCLLYEI